QGKVLYWGVSQWPAHAIAEAARFCRTHALPPPISNQPLYNLFDRGIEAEVMPVAAAHGVGQIVYSPLAQGVLTGKYVRGRAHDPGTRATTPGANQFIGRYLADERLAQAERAAAIARRLGVPPARLALAWCLRRPEVASVIVGAASPAQVEENAAAAGFELPADVIAELEQIFPA
ncbi:MAG TPA: aldo/keto reductase, partial [Planctomycetota bacterium]|nr:aldo/keto reductase [Planctomycetota bacterium]